MPAQSALAAGHQVWVPAVKNPEREPYELAEVLSTEPLKVFLVSDGTFAMPKEEAVVLANSGTEKDNTSLLMISDATLLANTRERFVADEIYTFTGSIVTSVNPCKPLAHLYDEAAMAKSLADRHTTKAPEPHLFATAESAYETLVAGGRDQSIVVSGISGAGKTEAIKYIMRYLCWRAASRASPTSAAAPLAELVMRSNPLFEALGNATTVNNPNSSRFGKFIRLRVSEDGGIGGALIDTYLLEKSRLSAQQPGERNFHLFYQLLAGAPESTLSSLKLTGGTGGTGGGQYHYLGDGADPFAPVGHAADGGGGSGGDGGGNGGSDAAAVRAAFADEFAATSGAMAALGVDVASIGTLLAGLLHLGNVSFVEEGNGSESGGGDAPSEGCSVAKEGKWFSASSADKAAQLLGLKALPSLLTRRTVQAGGGRSSTYDTPLSVAQACFTRDALAKRLYDALFTSTVAHMNGVLGSGLGNGGATAAGNGNASSPTAPAGGWIGLLDVFGFEIFARNGFEQLMVNLANERLQRFFLVATFQKEQAEYTTEELPWVPIVDVPDNSDCIASIEAMPYGVLPLLDEQCRLGERGTDGALCSLLNARNGACVAAAAALGQKGRTAFRPDETFTIRHFVQPVTYTARDFLERNRDTFYHDLARAVAASSNPFVRGLIDSESVQTAADVAREGTGKSYATVALAFGASLTKLLEELGQTDAGFVRCIKPNASLSPDSFHSTMALHQLRTCGMVQAVRMMMAMYGARLAYDDIAAGWVGGRSTLPAVLARLPPKELVQSICRVFDVPLHDYAFGKTKLFFRAGRAVGLSAFCREAASAEEAKVRSAVLLWKLTLERREHATATKLAAWVARARTALKGAAYATAKQRLYVQTEAQSAAERAGTGLTAAGGIDADAPSDEVAQRYAEALARRYRLARRAYAVGCVESRAATRIQKHARALAALHHTQEWREELRRRAAALKMSAAARGRQGRKRFKNEHEAWIERVTPSVLLIQAAWRATAPQRYRKAALAAAVLLQCTWRMYRIRRLHMRLVQAILFLKKGGLLSKYRARHVIGERHSRYVRLTADLTTLEWVAPGKEDLEPDPDEKAHNLSLSDVQAVTDGAKTKHMKRMYQRADAGGSVFEKMLGLTPYELELRCAFSIIVKERTIDFVAPSPRERDSWLQHLNILLIHQRTHDTERVITRKDVVEELHMISFQIGKLMRQSSKAKARIARLSQHMDADKQAIKRMSQVAEH